MGQTQQKESQIASIRQGFHPLRKTPIRCLSADVTLYQKGNNFLAHAAYPIDAKSPQLLIENDRYYAQRTSVSHGNILGISSYDFVVGSIGVSVKGSLGNLSHWGEEGKTNVNALCSLSIFEQHCRKVLPGPSAGTGPNSLRLHVYHEYQGHTLESQIELRKQYKAYFQEKELWTLIAAASSAGKFLLQNGFKQPILSPNAIKIDSTGSFKVGEWQFSHFYEEMAEDEEETNFYEEGETFVRPASSRLACQKTKNMKKGYNILTNYYWAPQGTASLQKMVTFGRKGHQTQADSITNNQIFSLGMTVLHICLMRPVYQSETFSEKKISSYMKQASSLRNSQKIPLSGQLIDLLMRMLAWDAEQRIGYIELSQIAKNNSRWSVFSSQSETPMESGTCRSKLNPTKSLLFVEGKDSGVIRQGFGDSQHPLEQSHKLNIPCTMRQQCSLNYEKIDFTIKRERREWQKFENRIQEDSYKVKPSTKMCTRQLFTTSTFSFPAEILMEDGEDDPHSEILCIAGTNERQKIDVEYDSNIDINCTNSIEQSIKLLDISNIKAQDQTKQISKQRHSHIRVMDGSLSNIFAQNRVNTDISKEDSMLLKSSVCPLNPSLKNEKDQSLFTPPELMALIRSSVYTGHSRKTKPQINQNQPPMIASEMMTEMIQSQLSNSVFVKQSFAKGYYEGGKADGLRSGYGTFYYRQGGKYCGDWDNNQMHGKGTLYYADGRIAYQGDWSHDSLKGKGILYNEKPAKLEQPYDYSSFDQSEECWVYYEGNFHNDDKWGRGVLQLSNGQRFQGSFKNDLIEGRGVFYTMDGRRIIGDWQSNQLIRVVKEEQTGQ